MGGVSASRIRPAEERDLPELVRIYNHFVTTTHITFDTQAFTVNQRRPWFESFSGSSPHRLLVAEVAHQPVGYASSCQFRARPAYDQSVETTIYLGKYWDVSWYEKDVSHAAERQVCKP